MVVSFTTMNDLKLVNSSVWRTDGRTRPL